MLSIVFVKPWIELEKVSFFFHSGQNEPLNQSIYKSPLGWWLRIEDMKWPSSCSGLRLFVTAFEPIVVLQCFFLWCKNTVPYLWSWENVVSLRSWGRLHHCYLLQTAKLDVGKGTSTCVWTIMWKRTVCHHLPFPVKVKAIHEKKGAQSHINHVNFFLIQAAFLKNKYTGRKKTSSNLREWEKATFKRR